MKSPEMVFHPSNMDEVNALKAIAKALKIKFEMITSEKPYNAEFVEKILESKKQIEEGKTIKIDLNDLWK
jgi:hypothetical protein